MVMAGIQKSSRKYSKENPLVIQWREVLMELMQDLLSVDTGMCTSHIAWLSSLKDNSGI